MHGILSMVGHGPINLHIPYTLMIYYFYQIFTNSREHKNMIIYAVISSHFEYLSTRSQYLFYWSIIYLFQSEKKTIYVIKHM